MLQYVSYTRGYKNKAHNAQYQAIPVLEEDGREYSSLGVLTYKDKCKVKQDINKP